MSYYEKGTPTPNGPSRAEQAWTFFHRYGLGTAWGRVILAAVLIVVICDMAALVIGETVAGLAKVILLCMVSWVVWRPLLSWMRAKLTGTGSAGQVTDGLRNTGHVFARVASGREIDAETIQQRNAERRMNRGR
jgi:hypothetical protein